MTQSVECVACQSRDVYAVEQWPAKKPRRALACRECGLLFIHPQPPPESFPSPQPLPAQGAPTLETDHVNIASKTGASRALIGAMDQYLPASRPPADSRVLCFGRNVGPWLNALRERGWLTFGIEPSATPWAGHTRLTSVPVNPEFDLAIVYGILANLPRPLDVLREVAHALRPGGFCLVSVPRLDTLGVHRDIKSCLDGRKSIAAFTEACLRGLLARSGLEVVAALHELDFAFSRGEPRALRLLARKSQNPVVERCPANALEAVLQALTAPIETIATSRKAPVTAASACPACDGSRVEMIEPWTLPGDTHAARCLDCGLLFVHPQPTQEALDAYYSRADGYLAWKANRLPDEQSSWGNVGTPRRSEGGVIPALFTGLDAYVPVTRGAGSRVLDFGCGPGAWLDLFQEHGWETYGLEPCTDAAFVRHKRLVSVTPEPQFDFVFLYHVLEHLPRPLDTIRELSGALRPGGHCFISVPRIDTLGVHRQVDYCLHSYHHIVGFTEACLRGLLGRAGLDVVASFSDFSSSFSKGRPTRLQLLARKVTTPPALERDPASALRPVIDAFLAIRKKSA